MIAISYCDPQAEWQPIDTAPKDMVCVIGWNAKWYRPMMVICYGDKWGALCEEGQSSRVRECMDPPTHWMPLPKPPTP